MAISKIELNGVTQMDITDTTAEAADVALGKYFYLDTGVKTEGTAVGGGGGSSPALQEKTGITPSESSQTITADSGYDGLSSVQINGISSSYIGSGVTQRNGSDLAASGATVTVPSGYYADTETKTITSGSAATPATSITANVGVNLDTTTGLITATASGTDNVTPTVSAGYVSSGTSGTITVSGSNTLQLSTQAASVITPTESIQTAVAQNKYTLGAVQVGAISSTYVGSGITSRSSSDLTVSYETVNVPAGYYQSAASKSVTVISLPNSTSANATSGYTSKATIETSSSDQYINIPPGYNLTGGYYKIPAAVNGSVGTPTATKGAVSNHSVSILPSVTSTSGYITGGTKTGTAVTVSASELVSGSQTISSNGTVDVTNLASVVVAVSGGGGSGATVKSATATGSSSSLTLQFTGLSAQPSAFAVIATASITINSTRRVTAVVSDGTHTYGCCVYKPNGNNNGTVYTSNSWYTWSYSSGSLTITSNSSSNGGYWNASDYTLIYSY